jgi:hypothetical protein
MINTRSLGVLAGMLLYGTGVTHGAMLDGHTLQGSLEKSPYYDVYNLQNWSNQGSPQAVVTTGPEFSADFDDVFAQHWHLTADFQNNYQLVVHSGGAPSQIGTNPWFVRWHFHNFDFPIADVQWAPEPDPLWNKASLSFDANNIWIAFIGLYPYPPYDSYTFQIVPAPEPTTMMLCTLGGRACLMRRRKRAAS